MDVEVKLPFEIMKLNGRLFENCFAGVDDEISQKRPNERTNSMAFIACHLVDARCFMARLLGIEVTYSFKEKLDKIESVEEFHEPPGVSEILEAWSQINEVLDEEIARGSKMDLKKKPPVDFPIDDDTTLGGILFLLEHESFHIGQLAFLRKFFFLDSMEYSDKKNSGKGD